MDALKADELQELVAIATSVGWGAADILLAMKPSDLNVQDSGDGPVTAADMAANHYILENLQATCGTRNFGYLSEETYKIQASGEPIPQPCVWVIDPLDGTRDYIKGTGEYAIHIALLQKDRPVLAVVACPAVERLYFATLNGGTFVEKRNQLPQRVQVSQRNRIEDLTMVASRSHRDERFNQLLNRFPIQHQRSVGSVGGKIAAILEHTADVYLSLPGKSAPKDWDLAAPELVLTEAGGQFTHFDGSPLKYNQAEVSQWGGVIASNGPCHSWLCDETTRILAEIDKNYPLE
ncbi:3'(2'),5'-bisphosphate nucleotidase CysQ family protein [Leptothermofonsia sichuanensis]|uniref:3'(2'),5'-bisphosphate nucleotidase CysQ family protein n=1 Tax=Leptothermofonsia sichuanensis TaxID=2917832 RepID=UPI001CEC94B6|nr:3'(2'),5'-bisphosphate nucleotidase CysQ [Leptothermofonsia sichuanensis]